MHITPRSLARFFEFMEKTSSETYPETPSEIHNTATERAMANLLDNFNLPYVSRILDVGCGQGVALRPFQEKGYAPVGITLNETDALICKKLGFDVRIMDQSFLEFEDVSFDLVWARHVLEHSFMPLYTLTEFNRVLRSGGVLYVEVPAPDTVAHEKNHNHYSILGKTMWESLLSRSGFNIAGSTDYFMKTVDGRSDEYWGFYCLKQQQNPFIPTESII